MGERGSFWGLRIRRRCYNSSGVFSDVDPERPDLTRFPRFRHARLFSLTLGPGEGLLIPVGWWHHVRALDICINVSFLNFVFPNNYEIPDVYIEREAGEER